MRPCRYRELLMINISVLNVGLLLRSTRLPFLNAVVYCRPLTGNRTRAPSAGTTIDDSEFIQNDSTHCNPFKHNILETMAQIS